MRLINRNVSFFSLFLSLYLYIYNISETYSYRAVYVQNDKHICMYLSTYKAVQIFHPIYVKILSETRLEINGYE